MPLDRYGRVIVNPSVPLGMDDFAAMYTANGMTPQQNASDLWMNAPTEGKSYMSDQWSRFNTGTSPEQYFSDPARVAAVLASSPSGGGGGGPRRAVAAPAAVDPLGRIGVSGGSTGHEQWPMYNSESARNVAMNLGMDRRGEFTTPTRMLESVTDHLRSVPSDHLLDDPELQKLMKVDPAKAKYVYQQLSGLDFDNQMATRATHQYSEGREAEGRKYAEAKALEARTYSEKQYALHQAAEEQQKRYEEQKKFERLPMEFGIKTVQDLIARGAHFDPNTGELSTWQNVEPEAGAVLGGDNRPVRKRMPATPEERHIWEKYYPLAMGMPTPQGRPVDPQLGAAREAAMAQPETIRTKVADEIKRWEGQGVQMTPQKIRQIIDKVEGENKPLFAAPGEDSRYADFTTSFMSGIMGRQGWQPGMSDEQTQRLPQNAWGKFADKYIMPVQDFFTGRDFTPEEVEALDRKARPAVWAAKDAARIAAEAKMKGLPQLAYPDSPTAFAPQPRR